MSLADVSIIVEARNRIMAHHGITSEAALNLLVSLATAEGATVLRVAREVCDRAEGVRPPNPVQDLEVPA